MIRCYFVINELVAAADRRLNTPKSRDENWLKRRKSLSSERSSKIE